MAADFNHDSSDLAYAREAVLVDAQCLLQKALNIVLGDPRKLSQEDPVFEALLFKAQREYLVRSTHLTVRKVNSLFTNESNMSVKDLGVALRSLGFELELSIKEVEKKT